MTLPAKTDRFLVMEVDFLAALQELEQRFRTGKLARDHRSFFDGHNDNGPGRNTG